MKRSLPLCALLLSSFVLSGCNDAQIAEYAKQNDIILTPEVVNSLQNSQVPNTNMGIGNGNNSNPVVNPNIGNKPNTPNNTPNTNPNNSIPVVRIGQGRNSITVPLETATQMFKGDVGPQGPQGPQGPKGDDGDRGEQGEKGDTGRGIESLEINDEGHLIAHYTDGESQDVGLISNNSSSPQQSDFEKVGYVLPYPEDELQGTHHNSTVNPPNHYEYSISNLEVKLDGVNNDNPSRKYHYVVHFDYTIRNYSMDVGTFFSLTLDSSYTTNTGFVDSSPHSDGNYSYSTDFYSSIPYNRITDIEAGENDS